MVTINLSKDWFYRKIFYITDESLFDKFKKLLLDKRILNDMDYFASKDIKAFRFNKDKPLYRITDMNHFGCGTAKGYGKFEEYKNYSFILLREIGDDFIKYDDCFNTFSDYLISLYSVYRVETPTRDRVSEIYTVPYVPYTSVNNIPDEFIRMSDAIKDSIDSYQQAMNNELYERLFQGKFDSNDKKEDKENIMKLLEIYKDRKTEQIYQSEKKTEGDVKLKDKDYAAYKKLNNDKVNFIGDFSDEIKKQLREVEKETADALCKVESMVKEVEAQLEICETYEQKVAVLKLYNILDEDGKLSI